MNKISGVAKFRDKLQGARGLKVASFAHVYAVSALSAGNNLLA